MDTIVRPSKLVGCVCGPVLRYTGEFYTIEANMYVYAETSEARPSVSMSSERDSLRFLNDYQVPLHLARLDAEIRGLHILFHHDLIQFAVTYRMREYWAGPGHDEL